MATLSRDAYRVENFRFTVTDTTVGSGTMGQDIKCSKITGLNQKVEEIAWREGNQAEIQHKQPGQMMFDDLTIERPMQPSSTDADVNFFLDWFKLGADVQQTPFVSKAAGDNFSYRKDLEIAVLDRTGSKARRYRIVNAFVKERTVSDLDASANEILKETCVIAIEYMEEIK